MPTAQPDKPVAIAESAGALSAGKVQFKDDELLIENAAIFGPPLDPATGYYVSDKGRHYSREFHQSVVEYANKGVIGFPYHPEPTQDGGYKMRDASKYTHRTVAGKAWIDESSGRPVVRASLKFKNSPLGREAYEGAKESPDILGISLFVPSALWRQDKRRGVMVFESIDPDQKRPITVDLVEASGATNNILESARILPKETAMPDQSPINVEELTAQIKASVLESVRPELERGQKAVDEAAAYRKAQLVESRLAEKKMKAEYVSPHFKKALLEAADESAIDALIEAEKARLAKLVNPVAEAGGEGQGGIDYKPKTSLLEDVNSMGLTSILEQCGSGAGKRDANVKRKLAAIGLKRIGDFKDQSEDTNKLRKAISEQAYGDPKFFKKIARACGITEDVLERPDFAQAILETTDTPIDSTGFTTINGAVVSSELILGYNIVGGPEEGMIGDVITKPYPSRVYPEVYAGFTASGGIGTIAEGALPPDATMAAKTVSDPASRPSKYGVFASVSREEILLDKTNQVLERANRCGLDARVEREKLILTGVFDLNNTQNYIPYISNAYTATPQFTNTDGNTAIASNSITNPLSDYSSLWTAVQTLRGIKDENGRPLIDNALMPNEMIVGSSQRELALSIVNAREYRRGSAGGSGDNLTIVDAANFGFSGNRVLFSILAESITGWTKGTWYIAGRGGCAKQYLRKEMIPFEVVQIPQSEIRGQLKDLVAGVKAEFWFWIVPRDQRYVLQNKPS